jgi:hypothetical protein
MAEHGSVRVHGIDPRTGQLVGEPMPASTPEQLETLVQAAARTLPTILALHRLLWRLKPEAEGVG